MVKKAAYSLGTLGTLVVLGLRWFDAEPMLAFGLSALTILGLAFTLGHATEQLGIAAGPRIGGILNATVGNIGEIIIAGSTPARSRWCTPRLSARSSATCSWSWASRSSSVD